MNQSINRSILKALIFASFVLCSVVLLYGISRVFYYFNTGADRSTMLPQFSEIKDVYNPSYSWNYSDPECEKKPDTIFLNKLTRDYLNAFYSFNSSQRTSKSIGLKDYFIDPIYGKMEQYLADNKKNKIRVESTSLSHHMNITYFSNDAQVIRFIDSNVLEYNRIYRGEKPFSEKYNWSNYEVVMKLENGKWKIRQFDKISIQPPINNTSVTLATDSTDFIRVENGTFYLKDKEFQVKGINYYPQNFPWNRFWKYYDEKIIKDDIALIKKSGLNSVRIFIPLQQFDDPKTFDDNFLHLQHFLKTCAKNEIYVMITLFDFYSTYQTMDWTFCDRHIEKLVKPLANDPTIMAWDIKNEPDLDFKNHPKEYVTSWINFILTQMRTYAPNQLITIGWSNLKDAENFINGVDFISAHYYLLPEDFAKQYATLKSLTPNKPIVIQEYGTHSYNSLYFPDSRTIWDQEAYYKSIHEEFKKASMNHYMAWTLYDFKSIPNEVVGKLPWRKKIQQNFGFIDKNGNVKPAFKYVAPNYDKIVKKKINRDRYNLFYFMSLFVFLILIIFVILLGFYVAKIKAKVNQ